MTQSCCPVFFRTLLCFCLSSWVVFSTYAQTTPDKCATVPFNDKLNINRGIAPQKKKDSFEQWINAKKKDRVNEALRTLDTKQDAEVLRVPVVVHVIHRGEAEGQGTNIPLEQIEDQIRILNEDFRRQNADQVQTLPIFQPVAADIMIEFVLAKQTPDGFLTNGITRTQGEQQSYGLNSASSLSNLSYWPAEDYFNIWVVPLSNSYLGYAQFPVSSLEGLENSSNNRETDGIVIDYRYFGSVGNAASNSLGRTTTHEVGHFFGLRHIWGDGDCSADDFVTDTPLQAAESDGCPFGQESCGSPDMYQNYMDYTDDVCMNLFTQDQKDRMLIVLFNSPRRASLLNSPGLDTPVIADNDAGIEEIISPLQSECSGQITPILEILNAGSETINSVSVHLYLQGNLISELQANPSLSTGETAILTFPLVELGQNFDFFDMEFRIVQVNDTVDENSQNNVRSISFIIPQTANLPLEENFEDINANSILNTGIIRNPDELTTWSLTDAPGFDGQVNQLLYLNYYDYDTGLGERDYLYTPIYDLSGLREAQLSFRYAYAPYRENNDISNDGFIVGISTNCGATIEEILFEASGTELGTMEASNASFVPTSRADWRKLEFSLDKYVGQPNVQLVFIGINDFGNNLYLDDIQISIEEERALDIAITDVQSPTLLSCNTTPIPEILVQNNGSTTINSFEVSYQIDEQSPTSFVYNAFPLNPGESREFTFEQMELAVGLHTLSVTLSDPNSRTDEQPLNNQLDYTFYVDDQIDIIPLLQDFNQVGELVDVLQGNEIGDEIDWLVVNPDGQTTWQVADTAGIGENNATAFINLYEYQLIGTSDLLVSPTLDLTTTDEASVFFKISYALLSDSYADTLRLKVSTDCGLTYETVYERAGADLAITTSTEAWIPQGEADWRQEFVNLSDYAGMADVRVAFEVVNAYGNNLYLDDIEFYNSAEQEPVARKLKENDYRVFPNPYFANSVGGDGLLKIAFNLPSREDVTIILLDSQGKLLSSQLYPSTLNQTYGLDLSTLSSGMYIFKVVGRSINKTSKLLKQ